MSELINLNGTTPAPTPGFQLTQWQRSTSPSGTDPTTGNPYYDTSAQVPSTGGVSVKTANYTIQASDCGKLIVANSTSAIAFTLPAAVPFAQWEVRIANIGAGALSVAPGGSLDLDGGTAAVSVAQYQSLSVATDGTNYFSARGIGSSPGKYPVILSVASGSALIAGNTFKFPQVLDAGTIIGWDMTADQAGSVSIDIWKIASGGGLGTAPAIPTSANKISASAGPSLSSAQSASQNAAGLTGWTTTVAANDVFGFNIASATTVTAITLQIWIQRS